MEAITCNHGSSVVAVSWPRSRSGVAPTLMETEAVTVDEGRGQSAWDEAAGGRCLRTAAEGILWGPNSCISPPTYEPDEKKLEVQWSPCSVRPGAYMYEAGSL
jgi:hypothetical protein